MKTRGIITIVILGILGILIISSVTIVPPGYVGVVEILGHINEQPLYSGFHFVIPIAVVHKMDTRLQAYTMSVASHEGERRGDDAIDALTSEGLKIRMDLTAWYQLEPKEAPRVYSEIGKDYVRKIVRPLLRTAIRDVAVKYTAEDIYSSKRDSVVLQIIREAKELSTGKGIDMERVLLRNVILPQMVQDAIDTKLAADQDAQKMKFVLEKEKREKERKVIEAEGIREANRIIAQGLTRSYIQWYRIEMLKQLVTSPNNTIIIIPDDLKSVPMIMPTGK